VALPVMLIHGSDDEICLVGGSNYIYQHLGTDITQRRFEVNAVLYCMPGMPALQ
jgi:hypothetical protein